MNLILQYINLKEIEDKIVVCFGCFRKTKEFAMRLLSQNICFDYFLFTDDGNYCLPHLLNKPVIGKSFLNNMDNYVIVASWNEFEYARQVLKETEKGYEQNLIEIERLQPDLKNTPDIIIYGQGKRAERLLQDLDGHLEINSFCDSDKEKTGGLFHGKPVIHASSLPDCSKDTCIIIGSTYYDEIRKILLQYHIKESQIFYMEYDKLVVFPDKQHKCEYQQGFLFDLLRDFKGKRVVLYGEKNTVKILALKLSYLGIEIQQLIERNAFKEDGTIYSLAYYNMHNSVCIITDPYSSVVHDALENIGLKPEQYAWLQNYNSYSVTGTERLCHYVLDPNMGFSRIGNNEEYAGIVKYEYKNSKPNKPVVILTLGGSTTAAHAVRQKSWSEYLSGILSANNINHIIYCGGVNAYKASQELLKLIRDGIWLKPDYVLSYSGANNMNINSKTPFIDPYQKKFFDKIVSSYDASSIHGVNYGIEPECSNYEYWFMQIKMMYAICNSFNINYKAFLQPVLYSKKFKDEMDPDLDIALFDGFLLNMYDNNFVDFDATELYKKFYKNAINFRNEAKKVNEPWFYDLSGLFDGHKGVYMDLCHVYEKGNKIIAEKIYEILKEDFYLGKVKENL